MARGSRDSRSSPLLRGRIQSLTWSVLPNNTPPGSELLSGAVAIATSAIALLMS